MNEKDIKYRIALFPADYWEHVCPKVRVIAPAVQNGFEVLPGISWSDGDPQINSQTIHLADIVVIQRNFPQYQDLYQSVFDTARSLSKPVIYEMDDLLIDLPAWHNDKRLFDKASLSMQKAMIEADMVTCSTTCIAESIAFTNAKIRVLPNFLIDDAWLPSLAEEQKNQKTGTTESPVVVGYVGGHSHGPDLDMLKPVFMRLSRQYENRILFQFWGCPPPVEMRQWSNVKWSDPGMIDYYEYAKWLVLQSCDIFIAPLRDCRFNQCKSALKYLEYSVLGVPGVYSDPGPYAEVIRQGETGYLAKNLMEWVSFVGKLIEDPDLRQEIGLAAKASVIQDHLLSDHARLWMDVYTDVLKFQPFDAGRHAPLNAVNYYVEAFVGKENEYQQFARENEILVSQQEAMIIDLEDRLTHRNNIIDTIIQSPGWRLLAEVGRVRKWFIPSHSFREKLFFSLLNKLSIIRKYGLKGLFKKTAAMPGPGALANYISESGITFVIGGGDIIHQPYISIIVIVNDKNANIDIDATQLWAAEQTLQAFEIINWNREQSFAFNASTGETVQWIADYNSLRAVIHGTYLVFASQHLLEQAETYLETNLIALKTENLAFTVNLTGQAHQEMEYLENGLLPGSITQPFEKLFIHQACITPDIKITFGDWQQDGVLGKIIHRTTNNKEDLDSYPYKQKLPFRVQVSGNYLIDDSEPIKVKHIHPVGSVLTSEPIHSNKPTVFVVMPYVAVGGAEHVALDMLKVLRNDVRFVIISTDMYDHSLGTKADAFRQITPYVYTAPDFLHDALKTTFWRYLIERFQPKTFYVANGSESIYTNLSALHGLYPDIRFANQVYDHRYGWIERYDDTLIALMDANIGCNHKISQAYVDRGIPEEKSYQIENGIDCNVFNPELYPEERIKLLKEIYQLPMNKHLVTFMARLHPQKRPMDFVEVARRFQNDPSMYFLIVGGGPLTSQIDLELLRTGLKNVTRRPFSLSSDILAISDVFVLPSEYEGMPLTILESLALGTPVVVTDVGNNREVLNATGGGVLVEQIGDINALRLGIIKLLSDPPDGQSLRNAVINNYSAEKMAQKYFRALLGD